MRYLFYLFLICAPTLFALTPAEARLRICNQTSYVMRAAAAYEVKRARNSVGRSVGWLQLLPGACTNTLGDIPRGAQAFVYAKSDAAHEDAGIEIGGDRRFCIDGNTEGFAIEGGSACRQRGYSMAGFAAVNTSTRGNATVNLKDGGNFSSKRARAAGVQRLLTDLGYEIGRIDGFGGAQTSTATNAYRKANNLPRRISRSQLTQNLLRSARAAQRKRGLTLCNRTAHLVWAAMGTIKGDDYETHGWLKIPAKTCRKAINNALTARYYFTYAEAVDANGAPIIEDGRRKLWAGDFRMCAKPTSFRIDGRSDCTARGYDAIGFKQIDTGTKAAYIQNLR